MQGVAGVEAFGKPGIKPRWTHSNKDGVGTAYSASSHLWFTIWNGIVTEAYYPTIDRPQLRDLQYLITDGSTFFQEEKRNLKGIGRAHFRPRAGLPLHECRPRRAATSLQKKWSATHICLACFNARASREKANLSCPASKYLPYVLPILKAEGQETTHTLRSPAVNGF